MTARAAVPASGWVVLGATLLVGVLVVVDAPAPLRVPAALAWTLLAPGHPWVRRLGLRDRGDALAAAVAVSLAAAAVVGGLLALAGVWHALTAWALLAPVAVAGVLVPTAAVPEGDPS